MEQQPQATSGRWTFLTNHAHVLLCIAEDPDVRGRDGTARADVFSTADRNAGDWLVVIAVASSVLWLDELRKAISKRRRPAVASYVD